MNINQNNQSGNKKHFNSTCKAALWLLPILLCCTLDAYAAFDLDASVQSAVDPVKNVINKNYGVGIFITGAIGAMLQQQGDLRDRMLGFGKGAMIGGIVVAAVKTYLGV